MNEKRANYFPAGHGCGALCCRRVVRVGSRNPRWQLPASTPTRRPSGSHRTIAKASEVRSARRHHHDPRGTYREWVKPCASGDGKDRRITYRAAPVSKRSSRARRESLPGHRKVAVLESGAAERVLRRLQPLRSCRLGRLAELTAMASSRRCVPNGEAIYERQTAQDVETTGQS
jgi:hypothetical protein